MYKTKYTFWNKNSFDGFVDALNELYENSRNHYINTHKEVKENELKMFDVFMKGLENYYASLITSGIVNNSNYINVLNQLKSISLIIILPEAKRNLYGVTLGYQIAINPEIGSKDEYNETFMKQLCISHEIGHVINNKWTKDTKSLSKRLYEDSRVKAILEKIDADDPKYLQFGFSLLDEVVAEEAAEYTTYRLNKMKRPNKELRRDKKIFNHNPYLTNYILYGELQELALSFSKSMDCIRTTKNSSDDDVMFRLVCKSFNDEFLKDIEKELVNSDTKKLEKLITMIACMGKIKAATYEVVGINKNKENIDVGKYVDIFNSVKGR